MLYKVRVGFEFTGSAVISMRLDQINGVFILLGAYPVRVSGQKTGTKAEKRRKIRTVIANFTRSRQTDSKGLRMATTTNHFNKVLNRLMTSSLRSSRISWGVMAFTAPEPPEAGEVGLIFAWPKFSDFPLRLVTPEPTADRRISGLVL